MRLLDVGADPQHLRERSTDRTGPPDSSAVTAAAIWPRPPPLRLTNTMSYAPVDVLSPGSPGRDEPLSRQPRRQPPSRVAHELRDLIAGELATTFVIMPYHCTTA